MAVKEKKKKYFAADQAKIQKKLEQIGSGAYFKPKEGKSIVRILPPWSDSGLWYKEAALHYGLKDDSDKDRAYPCLKMFDKDCPICNKSVEFKEGDGEDKKVAGQLRAKVKFYANVLDRATSSVKIWGFSQKTLGILLSYCSDPDYGDISDPDEGFDVAIERTGTGKLDTRYQIRVKPKASAVDIEGWENQLINLDQEVVEDMDEEALQEIVDMNFGAPKKSSKKAKDEDEEDEDEDEEEEKPVKKSKKQVEEDEDEEEEAPKKKSKKPVVEEEAPKKKSKKVVEEDDEEEEAPKKKSKKSKEEDEDEDDEDEDEDE